MDLFKACDCILHDLIIAKLEACSLNKTGLILLLPYKHVYSTLKRRGNGFNLEYTWCVSRVDYLSSHNAVPTCNFIQKGTLAQVFSCEFCETF